MTPIGPLITHKNYHLRMAAVHHYWATMYLRKRDKGNAAVQFRAAHDRLLEARAKRRLETTS